MEYADIYASDDYSSEEENNDLPSQITPSNPEVKWELKWSEEDDFNPADYPELARKLTQLAEEERKTPPARYINPHLVYMGSADDFFNGRLVDNSAAYAEAKQSQSLELDDNTYNGTMQKQVVIDNMLSVLNSVTTGAYGLGENISSFFHNIGQSKAEETKTATIIKTNTFLYTDDPESDSDAPYTLQDDDVLASLEYEEIVDFADDDNHKMSNETNSNSSESDDENRDAEYALIDDLKKLIKGSDDAAQQQDNASDLDSNYSSLGMRRRR